MPILFSIIALAAQLVIPVADGVPKFDIARGCRLDSIRAFDLSTGQNETVKRCVADEQQALAQLSNGTISAMIEVKLTKASPPRGYPFRHPQRLRP
jgi:hypothetical protein